MNFEEIKKRSQSRKAKPIIQYDLDGNRLTTWKSTYQASKLSGWKYKWQNIGRCALGNRLTAYGFVWRYDRYDKIC